jgi:hypothetical protein
MVSGMSDGMKNPSCWKQTLRLPYDATWPLRLLKIGSDFEERVRPTIDGHLARPAQARRGPGTKRASPTWPEGFCARAGRHYGLR